MNPTESPSSDTLMNLSWGINDGEAENLFDSKASFSPSPPILPDYGQRWASTLASRSNARHRSKTRSSIERSERLYFFEKPQTISALYYNRCRSLSITMSRDRLLHFQCKKHLAFYPYLPKALR
jgi:hypothetical protein